MGRVKVIIHFHFVLHAKKKEEKKGGGGREGGSGRGVGKGGWGLGGGCGVHWSRQERTALNDYCVVSANLMPIQT